MWLCRETAHFICFHTYMHVLKRVGVERPRRMTITTDVDMIAFAFHFRAFSFNC